MDSKVVCKLVDEGGPLSDPTPSPSLCTEGTRMGVYVESRCFPLRKVGPEGNGPTQMAALPKSVVDSCRGCCA